MSGLLMILFQGFVFSFCFVWLTQPLPVRTNRLAAAVVFFSPKKNPLPRLKAIIVHPLHSPEPIREVSLG